MKVYIVYAPKVPSFHRKLARFAGYVNGIESCYIKAASHNAAEKKAKAKYPDKDVSVCYTEV
jgi:hypothetical protein